MASESALTAPYWNTRSPSWYHALVRPRQPVHDAFLQWCTERGTQALAPILDIGCGSSLYYGESFRDTAYTGIDVSSTAIGDCWSRDSHPFHHYEIAGIESLDTEHRKWGLVFSHAVVDHVPDIPAFLAASVRAVRPHGWLYLTAYRGFHDTAQEHVYTMGADGCWYNDVSPGALRAQLLECGVHEFSVEPGPVCDPAIGPELVCVARVP
mgnify:CR=1 FL=1